MLLVFVEMLPAFVAAAAAFVAPVLAMLVAITPVGYPVASLRLNAGVASEPPRLRVTPP